MQLEHDKIGPAKQPAINAPDLSSSRRMPRVLLIEDDLVFADLLKESLEEDGSIQVVQSIDNETDAMNHIRGGALSEVDAVITDLQLPIYPRDRNVSSTAGLRIIEEIRQGQGFSGVVIVLTCSRSFEDGERALAAGCDGYLCKHAPASEIPLLIAELKLALRRDVMVVSSEMRHVFFREQISPKEARLLDLLDAGRGWSAIAEELGYKTAKAAANIGDRIFDKLLFSSSKGSHEGVKKRQQALEIWRTRRSRL
jgi:DNA-binding NarL/FixJ family response regulator